MLQPSLPKGEVCHKPPVFIKTSEVMEKLLPSLIPAGRPGGCSFLLIFLGQIYLTAFLLLIFRLSLVFLI